MPRLRRKRRTLVCFLLVISMYFCYQSMLHLQWSGSTAYTIIGTDYHYSYRSRDTKHIRDSTSPVPEMDIGNTGCIPRHNPFQLSGPSAESMTTIVLGWSGGIAADVASILMDRGWRTILVSKEDSPDNAHKNRLMLATSQCLHKQQVRRSVSNTNLPAWDYISTNKNMMDVHIKKRSQLNSNLSLLSAIYNASKSGNIISRHRSQEITKAELVKVKHSPGEKCNGSELIFHDAEHHCHDKVLHKLIDTYNVSTVHVLYEEQDLDHSQTSSQTGALLKCYVALLEAMGKYVQQNGNHDQLVNLYIKKNRTRPYARYNVNSKKFSYIFNPAQKKCDMQSDCYFETLGHDCDIEFDYSQYHDVLYKSLQIFLSTFHKLYKFQAHIVTF